MTATITERRAAATAELAELERARGESVLDGGAFDAGRLVACRAEIEALDAAEIEAMRRTRLQAEAERATRRKETRKALAGTLDEYMAAVGAAEKAARDMVENLAKAQSLAATMRAQCREIGGPVPLSLDPYEVKSKLSAALVTLLRSLGGQANYGCIKWNSSPSITHWTGHASKTVAAPLQPFIDGE